MSRDDGDIWSLMTHLKHWVRWPRTGANVNDALSRRAPRLAGGEAIAHSGLGGLSVSPLSIIL